MTTILVPTDFTPASVKLAERALTSGRYEKCNLVLFHAFEPPASPYDLLGAGYRDPSCQLLSEAFRQACKQLKDAHPKMIQKIVVRCLTGSTRAVFRNFADANGIDLIYCPEDFVFCPVHARSVDPLYLFKKNGIPVAGAPVEKKVPVYRPAYLQGATVSAQ